MNDKGSGFPGGRLLDEILAVLHMIKDDRDKLEQLHAFMMEEIYEAPPALEIPTKYQALVKEIAMELDGSMVCYVNPKTLEMIAIPANYFTEDYDDAFDNDVERVDEEWEERIVIEPPASGTAFRFMEAFVDALGRSDLKTALERILTEKKPFRNFNALVHPSPIRKDWFAFKQKCLETYAGEALMGHFPDF